MINLRNNELEREYRYWVGQLGESETTAQFLRVPTVSATEVLQAHFALLDHFIDMNQTNQDGIRGIGGIGPRDLNLLHSAVSRQFVGFGGLAKYDDKFDVCATLFYGICCNHAFHDCNKRTALLIALYQLEKCGRVVTVSQKELDSIAVKTAEHSLREYRTFEKFRKASDADVKTLAHFFKTSTRDIDVGHRTITYNQLNTALGKFGFSLERPVANRIDIVRTETKTSLLNRILGRRPQAVTQRIGTIGFHDWKKQVGRATLKEVKRITGLTPENGYDSEVLFGDYEPLRSLIEHYEQPLKRLANK